MNQSAYDVCQKLVSREVGNCVSMMVSHFAQNSEACCGDVTQDEIFDLCSQRIDNCDRIDETTSAIEDIESELSELEDLEELTAEQIAQRDQLTAKLKQLQNELADLEESDGDDVEALEHWIVSEWFGEKLQEKGEIVGELFGLTIWGRQCSGQAIALDSVIEDIARDMEILPGQPNAWTA